MIKAWEVRKGKCVFNMDGMCYLFGKKGHPCVASFCSLTEEALKRFISKGYQLQMWEIVKKKVKAWQSDLLYDVQVIAREGERKQYLWLIRECGTHIFVLPLNEENKEHVKCLVSMYGELEGYVIYPAKDVVVPIRLKNLIKEG